MGKKIIAVIDIGSLTARLKIYSVGNKERPKEIEAVRMYTSLGAKSYLTGVIAKAQIDEICDCLRMFDIKCKEYQASRVFCIATSALRDAGNSDVVIDQIRTRTRFRVELLDNSMERYYQNIAVRENMPEFGKLVSEGTMILDIGSSSLQASVYDKSEFIFSQNLGLGVLRIYEMLSDLQSRTTKYENVLEEFIGQDLNDYHAVEPKGIVYKSLIAFGGELGFMMQLAGRDAHSTDIMSREDFMKIYDFLLKTSPSDLSLRRHIPTNIAPLLLPSALIIKNMLEYTGVDRIYLPHGSLSDGFIFNYCNKYSGYCLSVNPEDDLVKAARNVAKRYKCDKKHVEFVENMSLRIFDVLGRFCGLDSRDRLLLQISAILHECGKYVHASDHNKAAYSLIRYTELIGLNSEELDTVAHICRIYPKHNPYSDSEYISLPAQNKVLISKLTAMLRLADSLDASHKQKSEKVSVNLMPDSLHILCTSADSMAFEEWSFEHRSELFEDVIGIKPELRVRRNH